MTSLIDVIFLLLLFFMLSSTFSKFAEVPLPVGTAGQAEPTTQPPLFLRVTADGVTLNGDTVALAALNTAPSLQTKAQVLIAITSDVSSQQLTDVLVALRGLPEISVNVLVPS
jgi:biopolymer transport protein ExbD